MDQRENGIRKALKNYAMMLKNAYIPSHKKKQIRVTMKSLEKELTRLKKEEQIESMRYKIAKRQANIMKLRGGQKRGSNIDRALESVFGPAPDYLGTMGGSVQRSRKRGPFDII